MCATCGCSGPAAAVTIPGTAGHQHEHVHNHHDHLADSTNRTVLLEERVLSQNDHLAEHNRAWLREHDVLAVNVMSSPGSGKTTLLVRTISDLSARVDVPAISVIEGDQETTVDAERVRATGCPVVQINTGSGCHLDAEMVDAALHRLDPVTGSTVIVENVGNLVCPALFDLGEAARVVIMSVTEGADKPIKYPHMFRTADAVILNKIDLLPYVDFDVDAFTDHLSHVLPDPVVLPVSATRGDGMDAWYAWLDKQR